MSVAASAKALGYDPRPELDHWLGTPIPPVRNPLRQTPERSAIADRVWWNGPPWTILRNAAHYLWHVMDYGRPEDVRHTLRDVSRETWIWALDEARPGLLSKGSYVLWSLTFDRIGLDDPCSWPDSAHRLDCRPLSGDDPHRLRWRHLRG
ncbi:MAG: hypothetical protein OXG51_05010 [Gammaproteobacteria bacterium]|nr:hypothetical protein [Gammaproteobacteria bacterium]